MHKCDSVDFCSDSTDLFELTVIPVVDSGGFKEWPLVQWPTRPLPYGLRRPLMKINKKIALQLPKQDFYSIKLCTVDKIHAVRPVDNNNDMPFPSQNFNSPNVWVGTKTKNAPTQQR